MECKGVLMGCTGPREPGLDPTWPAVDRVGSRRWAPLTPPLRRGGRGGCEEGVADEGHTLATAPYYRPLRTLSGELVLGGERFRSISWSLQSGIGPQILPAKGRGVSAHFQHA